MGPFLARLEALRQREAEALDAERRAASAEARLAEKDPWQFFLVEPQDRPPDASIGGVSGALYVGFRCIHKVCTYGCMHICMRSMFFCKARCWKQIRFMSRVLVGG